MKAVFKRALALMLAFALVLCLAACGDNGNDKTAAGTPQGDTTGSVETDGTEEVTEPDYSEYLVSEPVKITFWHTFSNAKRAGWIDEKTKAFNESNPWGITVEAMYFGGNDAIAEALAACITDGGKGLPGVSCINVPRVINYQNSGVIPALDNYIAALEQYDPDYVDMDDYLEAALDSYTMDNQLWGLPMGTSAACIIYNKTVCDENNLPMPDTWEEFKVWCKEIYEATGMTAFAFTNDFNYMNTFFMNCTGMDPLGDGTVSNLDNGTVIQFVKDVKELCEAGYCVVWDSVDNERAAMAAKTLVGCTQSSNNIIKIQALAEENGFEIDTKLGVSGTDSPAISTVSGASLITFSLLSRNEQAAAVAYMLYLTNSENNMEWVIDTQMLPSHYSVINSTELQQMYEKYPAFENVFEEAVNIISKNKSTMWQTCMESVSDFVASYANGTITEEAFDSEWANLVEEVNYWLADATE